MVKKQISDRELEILLKDRYAKPKKDCDEGLIYGYAYDTLKQGEKFVSKEEKRVIEEHLKGCSYCYYSYLEFMEELRKPITEEEREMIARIIKEYEVSQESIVDRVRKEAMKGKEVVLDFIARNLFLPNIVKLRVASIEREELDIVVSDDRTVFVEVEIIGEKNEVISTNIIVTHKAPLESKFKMVYCLFNVNLDLKTEEELQSGIVKMEFVNNRWEGSFNLEVPKYKERPVLKIACEEINRE
ncbi:MAG: hypothetical protein AB1630_05590 [bacterium]